MNEMRRSAVTEAERRYGDILFYAYPGETGRPRMSVQERAAQFSPFRALSGFEEAIAAFQSGTQLL